LHNLFQMLEVAYRLQSFRFLDGLVSSDSLAACYERLAHVLARRVLARARQGFHRAHRPREERLPYVRGRLDLARTLQRPWDARPQCRYETHTADIADNQILAWTLGRIARSGLCAPPLQATVRRAYRSLDGLVTPTPYDAAACADRLYNRLNEDYHALHALCRFFLEHSGPGHRVGERTMLPFLVHMARLYELFVAEWLRLHLAAARPGWSLKAQEQVAVGAGDALHFRVDLVLYDAEGAARMVLDTKYKTPQAPDAADVAQVVAYAQSRGCREAVLVYPQPLPRPLDARVGAVRVRTLSFALAGDLEQEGRAFLAALAE
jgi:5-methylcytosine-specific restriction enzyme subunit McrC